jgi:hypothetical protein
MQKLRTAHSCVADLRRVDLGVGGLVIPPLAAVLSTAIHRVLQSRHNIDPEYRIRKCDYQQADTKSSAGIARHVEHASLDGPEVSIAQICVPAALLVRGHGQCNSRITSQPLSMPEPVTDVVLLHRFQALRAPRTTRQRPVARRRDATHNHLWPQRARQFASNHETTSIRAADCEAGPRDTDRGRTLGLPAALHAACAVQQQRLPPDIAASNSVDAANVQRLYTPKAHLRGTVARAQQMEAQDVVEDGVVEDALLQIS